MTIPTSTKRLLTIIGCSLIVLWPITFIMFDELIVSIARIFGIVPDSPPPASSTNVGVALFFLVAVLASMIFNLVFGIVITYIIHKIRHGKAPYGSWLLGFTLAGVIGISIFVAVTVANGVYN